MISLSANKVNLNKYKRQFKQVERRLPTLLGTEAVNHTRENFRKGGFQDTSFDKWKPRKHDKDPGRGVLIGKGTAHLMRDIRVLSKTMKNVRVGTTLPYAGIHNRGGTIQHPGGTSYIPQKGKTVWVSKNKAAALATAGHKLPKTKPHHITIPRRQFLGKSAILQRKLNKIATRELKKIR